jgi:aminopeptidase N
MFARLLLLGLVLLSGTALAAAVEKPFSFNDTPGKLSKEVVPTEYSIRIVPSIGNFTFAGSETVKLNVRSPVHQLKRNC